VHRSAIDAWQTVPGSLPLQNAVQELRRRFRARRLGRTPGFTRSDPADIWDACRALEAGIEPRLPGQESSGSGAGAIGMQDALNYAYTVSQVHAT